MMRVGAEMLAILIPTGSDHDRSRAPVATLSLIAVNIACYVLSNLADYRQVSQAFGLVAAHPLPHQFFTHMFLHAGWPKFADAEWFDYLNSLLHIGGNMAYLWFAGSDVEDVLGGAKFLLLYFAGGIASALLFWATAIAGNFPNLHEPAVGASGAVSALLGFYVVRFPRFKIRMWFGAFVLVPFVMRQGIARVSSLVFIGFWIALQLVFGIRSLQAGGAEVAYWGHIGGFALGLAGALATRQARLGRQEFWMKEADYRFYKQKWYAAMELYQRLAEQFPACAEARVKWALCWECAGLPARAESVLRDALRFYEDNGLPDQAAAIREQLGSLTKQRDAPRRAAATTAYPNLMFRRKLKSEENRHD